mmetsp:Transcript_29425/g.68520  ORF Transcript_29425/g.68520 Transcript_29425/m.68520 type:complete len:505 (-) Transcript_29425:171-1685(-)
MGAFPIPDWIIGVCINLFGSTLSAAGLIVQKYSHSTRQGGYKSYWSDSRWVCGFSMYMAAQAINMVSMGMTPQLLLAVLGSWTLVVNTIFARVFLNESVGTLRACAVTGLVVSTVVVVYNAPRPSAEEEARQRQMDFLGDRFTSVEFLALTAFFFAIVISLVIPSLAVLGDQLRDAFLGVTKRASIDAAPPEGISSNTSEDLVNQAPKAASAPAVIQGRRPSKSQEKVWRRRQHSISQAVWVSVVPVSWATVAAVATGYTALCFKCVGGFLAAAVSGGQGFQLPWQQIGPWLILATAIGSATIELHCLNYALYYGEAAFVVPMYLALGMLCQLAIGSIFFQELHDFTSHSSAVGFIVGVSITVSCVAAVVMDPEQGVGDDGEDEEAGVDTPVEPAKASINHDLRLPLISKQVQGQVPPLPSVVSAPEVKPVPNPRVRNLTVDVVPEIAIGDAPEGRNIIVHSSGYAGVMQLLDANNDGSPRRGSPRRRGSPTPTGVGRIRTCTM